MKRFGNFLRRAERVLIIELASRLALYALLIANGVKAWHVLVVWIDPTTALLLAGGIETILMVSTQIITDRRVYNATKTRKSDPDKPVNAVIVSAAAFFGVLSAIANTTYFLDSGAGWFYGLAFGVAAPLAAGFVAYLVGDEAAVEHRLADFEQERQDKKAERQAASSLRKVDKALQGGRQVYVNRDKVDDNGRQAGVKPMSSKMVVGVNELLDVVKRDGWGTLEELGASMNVSRQTAMNRRNAAVDVGLLEKNGNNGYRVKDE